MGFYNALRSSELWDALVILYLSAHPTVKNAIVDDDERASEPDRYLRIIYVQDNGFENSVSRDKYMCTLIALT